VHGAGFTFRAAIQMPELPEVEAVRRALEPVMRGARFRGVLVRRPDLRIPFPGDFADRLKGRTVRALTRRGKFLLAALSSGETSIVHLGIVVDSTTAPHAGRSGAAAHDHVVFTMSSGATVTFNDPRRFGLMTSPRAATLRAIRRCSRWEASRSRRSSTPRA